MGHKSIAPKCSNSSEAVSSSTSSSKGCRRKIAFHPTLGYAVQPPLPAKVARRNARERNRVKQVNCGFEMLRAHIPSAAKQKKMSKVDTLRHAVEYIQQMQMMLNEKTVSEVGQPQSEVFHMPAYPLTPQTPTAGNMPFPPPQNCNESGYDTASSFYSSASPSGLMTPPTASALPPHYCNSPTTTTTTTSSANYEYTSLHGQFYYGQPHTEAVEAEEDELLDVIAKWQET